MRHSHFVWPWRYAFAAHQYQSMFKRAKRAADSCDSNSGAETPESVAPNHYESRWHGQGGRGFGVRRPLRYLSYKLDLDESQTRKMAAVLNQLKTEREQAEVDDKRTITGLAGLLEAGTPPLDEVRQVLGARVASAEALREETARAVVAISAFLDDDQREEFVSLLLTGSISL